MDGLKAFNYSCFLLQTFGETINGCEKIAAQNLLRIQNQASTRSFINDYSLLTVLGSFLYPDEVVSLRSSLS